MEAKQRLIDIICDYGDGITDFNTQDVNAILTENTIQLALLKEALWTMEWMWSNMKVVDPNLQSDAFNIPANGINSVETYFEQNNIAYSKYKENSAW